MTYPRLSGFDPGSQRFGWASGDGSALPHAGAWAFPQTGASLGKMLVWLDDALDAHYELYRPEAVVYEAPILVINQRFKDAQGQTRFRSDTLANVRKTYNLGGHIEFWCERKGIPCHEVDLVAVKKELAGFGAAQKSDMTTAAEKLGVSLPEGQGREDAADALGCWLLLLRAKSRLLSSRFDAALYGGRANALL